MTPRSLPLIRFLNEAGPDDRVFDGMLLAGPIIIVIIAIVGRTNLTSGLVWLYIIAIFGYVLYKGLTA